VAHRTSSTAADWANTFAKHNSGTYNNEWVVVDYKRFRRGYRHQKDYGIIQVVEQLPHFVVHADMTKELLESTYWPGYNTPCSFSRFLYFWRWHLDTSPKSKEKVRCRRWLTSSVIGTRKLHKLWVGKWKASAMTKPPEPWYLQEITATWLIWGACWSLWGLKSYLSSEKKNDFMSNNFTKDPLSRCNCNPPYSGENAIACRSELNPKNGTYPFGSLGFRDHGATDAKVDFWLIVAKNEWRKFRWLIRTWSTLCNSLQWQDQPTILHQCLTGTQLHLMELYHTLGSQPDGRGHCSFL